MTVDVEEYFCANNLRSVVAREHWNTLPPRVEQATRRLLDLFDSHRCEATFFVLGWVADRLPGLVVEIERRGHEVASHGYSHALLSELTAEQFDAEMSQALASTGKNLKAPIRGFRAPSFSIDARTPWVWEILKKYGIVYDSSVFPVGFHPDYGVPDAPLTPYHPVPGITEFPISCLELFGRRIPVSGGGYFRMLPYFVTRLLCRRLNQLGRPFLFYIHPWEIDPGQPRLPLPLLKKFRHYVNVSKTERRLDRILSEFAFTSIRKALLDGA